MFRTIFSREPVVWLASIAAVVTAFVTEAQGELKGEHAWLAVAWAIVTLIQRQLVTPADR